jgi:PAS domain S-box-containing protein
MTNVSQDSLRAALLDAIWDICDDAICSLDATGVLTSWNRSAERIFGFAVADVLGEPFECLFPDHLRRAAEEVVVLANRGERVTHFETEILRKDGMPLPISLCASPVHDVEDDHVVAIVVIARDITERQLTQAALAEAEARMRESEALARVGGWLWDVRTGSVQWSDQQHRIHGVDPLDFDGTLDGHLACIVPDDRDRVRAAMEESVASGKTLDEEYRIRRPDGQERLLYVRASPAVGSAGTVVGLRGIGQDVTAR